MGWRQKKEELEKEGVSIVVLKHILDRKITSKDLSSGALSYTSDISDKWRISQVLVCCRDGSGDLLALDDTTITVTFNSSDGATYDAPIGKLDFDGESSLGFIAGDNMLGVSGESGDEITIESSGGDNAGTLYVTIIYELLA